MACLLHLWLKKHSKFISSSFKNEFFTSCFHCLFQSSKRKTNNRTAYLKSVDVTFASDTPESPDSSIVLKICEWLVDKFHYCTKYQRAITNLYKNVRNHFMSLNYEFKNPQATFPLPRFRLVFNLLTSRPYSNSRCRKEEKDAQSGCANKLPV